MISPRYQSGRKPPYGTPLERCPPDLRGFLTEFYHSDEPTIFRPLIAFEVQADSIGGNCAYLALLIARVPRCGAGSAAMRWLCEMADRHNTTLRLRPVTIHMDGVPKIGTDLLQAWYERFGFRDCPRSDKRLAREPLTRG